jgi:hypothetical protein
MEMDIPVQTHLSYPQSTAMVIPIPMEGTITTIIRHIQQSTGNLKQHEIVKKKVFKILF